MNQLAQIIKDNGFVGTSAEIIAILDEDNIIISENHNRWGITSLNAELVRLGVPLEMVAGWDTLVGNLSSGSMLLRMLGDKDGIDLADTNLQSQMKVVRDITNDANAKYFIGILLDIGVTHGKKYQALKLTSLPTETEVGVALQQIADYVPPIYDKRKTLLSINIGLTTAISMRVQSAALIDGVLVDGNTLSVVGTSDAVNATLNSKDRAFIDSLLSLVNNYMAGI